MQDGAAEKTADALRADGHDVTGFTVDLADAEAAARWVDESAERHLRATGNSSIINTASMSGLRGIAPLGLAAHSAAKGGVIALTRTLAAEGAPDGIRANTISPGFVKSPATDKFVGDELRAFQMGMHLIRRPGLGEDIAPLAVYLASDESVWVTGQNYSIDGGVTAGFR